MSQDPYHQLASILLPAGILEFFELTQVSKTEDSFEIYLSEKNLTPEEYKGQELESKGFLPEVHIQDFPIRGQKVTLRIKRRRWRIIRTNMIVSRDWNLVAKGARMTTEFGSFLKGIFG